MGFNAQPLALTARPSPRSAQQAFDFGADDGRRFLRLYQPSHDICYGWYLAPANFSYFAHLTNQYTPTLLFTELWIMIIILLLINVLVPPIGASKVAFSIGSFNIFWESILQSAKIILRLVMMISLTLILTATTKPLDLTYALEWYMYPLKLIKFPTHEIAMTISIALRFIPTLLDETMRIMNAQASRGVDFEHGKIKEKIKAILSLIVPLFMSAFQRSEELANAMEARGYNPRETDEISQPSLGAGDTFSLIFITVLTAGVIVTSAMNWNFIEMIFGITTWGVALWDIGDRKI